MLYKFLGKYFEGQLARKNFGPLDYTSFVQRVPRANELFRKVEVCGKILRNTEVKILSIKTPTFQLLT